MKKLLFTLLVMFTLSVMGYASPKTEHSAGVVKVTLQVNEDIPNEVGYLMLLDPTATAYGNVLQPSGWLSWYCELQGFIFDYFQFKIPADAQPLCNAANFVSNSSVTIQIPAGIYDYVISYPFYQPQIPNGGSWAIPALNGRANDYVFEEGYKYTFVPVLYEGYVSVEIIIEEDVSEAGTPGSVTNLAITQDYSLPLTAVMNWTNPSVTVSGAPLAELTAIKVYENFGTTPIYTNTNPEIGGNESYTVTVPEQGIYTYMVVGENSEGEGMTNSTTLNICNVISTFPFQEGFENNATFIPLCWEQEVVVQVFPQNPLYWSVIPGYYGTPGTAQEGTMLAQFFGSISGSRTKLITPRIDLSSLENPVLKFWHTQREWFTSQDKLRIYYKNSADGEWILLEEYLTEVFDWTERMIGLPNKSADYYIAFEGEVQYAHGIQLDNISIINVEGVDGAALKLFGAVELMVDEPFVYKAQIQNLGAPISDYTVKLLDEQNNVLASNNAGDEIGSMESKMISLHYTPTVAGAMALRAVLELPFDINPDNNTTPVLNINVQSHADIFISTIGTDTTMSNKLPFNFKYYTSRGQSIYYNHEIIARQGAITQLQYFNNFEDDSPLSDKPLQIWMANTSLEKLNNWLPESEFALVYNAPISFPMGQNSCTIQLNEPFIYDGQSLVIMTNKPRYEFTGSEDNLFYTTETPEFSARSREYHNYTYEFNGTQQGNVTDYSPNIKMKIGLEGAKVSGTITSDGAIPVEGATVELLGSNAGHYLKRTTDADGKYGFDFLLNGQYQFKATKLGHYDVTSPLLSVETGNEYVVDITLTHLPTFSVSGTVVSNDYPDGLAGVEVKLSGYYTYSATTDENGYYSIPDVYATKTYNVEASKEGYVSNYSSVTVMNAHVIHNIALNEIAWAVGRPYAEIINNNVVVSWEAPGAFKERNYILDDGTAENGFRLNEGRGNLLGNKFEVGEIGELTSIDVFGMESPDNTDRPVTIQIYDESRNLVTSSDPFVIPANKWVNVPLYDNVPYSETFYVMIKWHSQWAGNSNLIGYDQNGPNSGEYKSLDWILFDEPGNPYFPQGTWMMFHEVMSMYFDGGPFLIRANANIHGKSGKVSEYERAVQPISVKPALFFQEPETLGISQITRTVVAQECKRPEPNKPTRALEKYIVYRLKENQPESEWVLLSDNVTETNYIDNNWSGFSSGIYQYAVKAKYSGNVESVARISNKLLNKMLFDYQINITTNSGDPVTGAIVRLTNQDGNPAHDYTKVANEANVTIADVWFGTYNLKISLEGHEDYTAVVTVTETGMIHSATLKEIIKMPQGLEIDVNNEENSALLGWNRHQSFFDDMESHQDFSITNIGNYTLQDFNGGNTYGIAGVDFPNQGKPHAFMVFNPSNTFPQMNHPSVAPVSGEKYLISFAAEEGANDGWLILPKLRIADGMKFSFWARTYTLEYPERIRVLVSTTGNNPQTDFKVISEGNYINLPEEWTHYSFDVSDYARKEIYLAINCVSVEGFFMMLDDISVEMDKGKSRSFTGYKVYLDGNEVNTITNNEYEFLNLSAGVHSAGVKSVYTSGESEMATKPFEIIPVGIENNAEDIQLYPNPFTNEIYINHPELVRSVIITDIFGQTVEQGTFNGKSIAAENLCSGVYFVTVESTAGKKTVYKMVNN